MAYPMDHGELILDTDACGVSIGAVLSQVQDEEERVIAYGSWTLNKSERNYCVTDKELLAVKHFIEHYKHYLLGRVFTVRTDHQALRWLFSLKEPKDRIARWIEVLSAYHFTVEYRPGKRHGNADAMSRCPNPRNCCCPVPDEPLKCGPCHKCQMRTEDSAVCPTHPDVHPKPLARRILTSLGPTVWVWFLWTLIVGMVTMATACVRCCMPLLSSRRSSRCCRVTRSQSQKNWTGGYTTAQLKKLQQEDVHIGPLHRWVSSGNRPYGPPVCAETRHYWNSWDKNCP